MRPCSPSTSSLYIDPEPPKPSASHSLLVWPYASIEPRNLHFLRLCSLEFSIAVFWRTVLESLYMSMSPFMLAKNVNNSTRSLCETFMPETLKREWKKNRFVTVFLQSFFRLRWVKVEKQNCTSRLLTIELPRQNRLTHHRAYISLVQVGVNLFLRLHPWIDLWAVLHCKND